MRGLSRRSATPLLLCVAGSLLALGVWSSTAWADGANDVSLFTPNIVPFTPGPSSTLSVSNMSPAPGNTVTVGLGVGPCTAGSSVTPWLVLAQDGTSPAQLPTAEAVVAGQSGGFSPTSVQVPARDAPGVYVLFVTCPSSDGTAVATHSLTVTLAGQVSSVPPPDSSWQAPSGWSDAQTRRTVSSAVDQAAGAVQPDADVAPAPPSGVTPRSALSSVHQRGNMGPVGIAAITAFLLALAVAGFWFGRRRHAGEA